MTSKPRKQDEKLEESLEVKVKEFANRMTLSGAKNLHPLVIRAVEKPLIAQILKETNWNQVQAALVLGLNRNTLRKKIRELCIQRPRPSVREPRRRGL